MEFFYSRRNAQFLWVPYLFISRAIKRPISSRSKTPKFKPLKLLRHLVNIASNEGDVIFDPFMGVGTTGVSSVKKGRRFIGSELNCDYVTAANKRIASYM
mgnify:CR=1 FL=1